ncbi:9571_t:CDS:2 [Funneliformis mosseae]|uniref:9571_t:CDS:1 n=1 Tax=Funneliformis mosseae TaxID=27381 RepID=A0A9N9B575_FUNMO|nr:9571_t:CDS:2 [Funneliformis mosseae]
MTSITCFRLSFKENETEKIFYVRANWKVDPLKGLLGRDEKVICELAVTDCKSFWTRNVTIIDLKGTKPDSIRDTQKFCEATQAALSGRDKYENQKLSCQITVHESNAKFIWKWSMQQTGASAMALQFTLGNISLFPVSQFETVKMWQEWTDYFIEERNQLIKSKNVYDIRVNDLEQFRDQMQEKIEVMTIEKIRNQELLIEKFKKVLNTKKKKVKRLMKDLFLGSIMSSTFQANLNNPSDEYLDENELEEEEFHESKPGRKDIARGKSSSKSRPFSIEVSSPSKKAKLDDVSESKSTIVSDSTNEDQEVKQKPESVLTKTFRGQVIKSRRMGRKLASGSNDSLNNILIPSEEHEPDSSQSYSPEIEELNETESADDLLAHM